MQGGGLVASVRNVQPCFVLFSRRPGPTAVDKEGQVYNRWKTLGREPPARGTVLPSEVPREDLRRGLPRGRGRMDKGGDL